MDRLGKVRHSTGCAGLGFVSISTSDGGKTEISTCFDSLWSLGFSPFSLAEEHYNVEEHDEGEIRLLKHFNFSSDTHPIVKEMTLFSCDVEIYQKNVTSLHNIALRNGKSLLVYNRLAPK